MKRLLVPIILCCALLLGLSATAFAQASAPSSSAGPTASVPAVPAPVVSILANPAKGDSVQLTVKWTAVKDTAGKAPASYVVFLSRIEQPRDTAVLIAARSASGTATMQVVTVDGPAAGGSASYQATVTPRSSAGILGAAGTSPALNVAGPTPTPAQVDSATHNNISAVYDSIAVQTLALQKANIAAVAHTREINDHLVDTANAALTWFEVLVLAVMASVAWKLGLSSIASKYLGAARDKSGVES